MQKSLLIFTLLFLFGCERKALDSDYFNGTIKTVEVNCPITKLTPQEVELDDWGWGLNSFVVYDSLMITWTPNSNKTLFQIYNLNAKKGLGFFCNIGRAKNEMYATFPLTHLILESNELKSYAYAGNEGRLLKWNISKSLETNYDVFDTIIDFKSSSQAKYSYLEPINDSTLLTYRGSFMKDLSLVQPELPKLEVRDIFSDTVYKEFFPFKKTFEYDEAPSKITMEEYNNIKKKPENYYYSITRMRPDGKYAVQGMFYLGQINIIDLETGEIKGVRLKGTPDFSLFQNPLDIDHLYFYGGIWATNDKIFVGYSGEALDGIESKDSYIYEFTWDGELTNIYNLGISAYQIVLDPVTRKFYATTITHDKLYVFDHKFD